MRLSSDFYLQDVLDVAPQLLGKRLVRIIDNHKLVCKIVEVEAYKGPEDKGSHAYGNRYTKRTKTMFKSGGSAYVYLIYGMHNLLNIVVAGLDQPQAVLIRAGEPLEGIKAMAKRRGLTHRQIRQIANGPGKLCTAMAVDRSFDGYDLVQGKQLYIEESLEQQPWTIVKSKRINIDYAEEYKDKLWRFYIKDNPCVSAT